MRALRVRYGRAAKAIRVAVTYKDLRDGHEFHRIELMRADWSREYFEKLCREVQARQYDFPAKLVAIWYGLDAQQVLDDFKAGRDPEGS
jgi:hypothetical protein